MSRTRWILCVTGVTAALAGLLVFALHRMMEKAVVDAQSCHARYETWPRYVEEQLNRAGMSSPQTRSIEIATPCDDYDQDLAALVVLDSRDNCEALKAALDPSELGLASDFGLVSVTCDAIGPDLIMDFRVSET